MTALCVPRWTISVSRSPDGSAEKASQKTHPSRLLLRMYSMRHGDQSCFTVGLGVGEDVGNDVGCFDGDEDGDVVGCLCFAI